MDTKLQDGLRILTAYLVALALAIAAGWSIGEQHPLLVALVADLAGTAVIFAFSRFYGNSSVYDPYWSVAPLPIALYFSAERMTPRCAIASALIAIWGVRLTYNWWRRWRGLADEDWRYTDLKAKTGRLYWLVSFLGIHLFPTLLVALGCLSLWPIARSPAPLTLLDLPAALLTGGAIALEAIADHQLHEHANGPGRTKLLDSGLWGWSRHPNYLGEISLWWGLYLFALAAGARDLWLLSGPLAMTGLFNFVSIPMVEKRCLARRPEYRDYVARTSKLIPWPPKR